MTNSADSADRRGFIGATLGLTLGAIAVDALAGKTALAASDTSADAADASVDSAHGGGQPARQAAYQLRVDVAKQNRDATPADLAHPTNGDEDRYPNKIGSFSKGLQHNDNGEVVLPSFNSMVTAMQRKNPALFEDIQLGGPRKLTNPQSALAFELEGGDARSFVQPPAPAFASAEQAAEIAENYWMALLRDVPYGEYASNPIAADAARDLTLFGASAKVPKSGGVVTPALLFRGLTPGDAVGPYTSQFMYQPIAFGANVIDQQLVTYAGGVDYMTDFPTWLSVQRGAKPGAPIAGPKRFILNGRDIGRWVHVDILYQAYFQAALYLLGIGAPLSPSNPYVTSKTQAGFGTLGEAHLPGLLGEFAVKAVHGVWYQKWAVHRRLRPEAFAARVHQTLYTPNHYPVHPSILNSVSSGSRLGRYLPSGSALLPMAFPEGSPTHPSYGAGHATVAGACVTLLKAWFDGSFVLPNPKQPSADGTTLVDYTGPALTVEGELNKLASNIGLGRNIAGVHWRSDATESHKLGEAVAIQLLREIKQALNEKPTFRFNSFAGTPVVI